MSLARTCDEIAHPAKPGGPTLEVAALKGISVASATWLIRDIVNLKARNPHLWLQATKGHIAMFGPASWLPIARTGRPAELPPASSRRRWLGWPKWQVAIALKRCQSQLIERLPCPCRTPSS